MRRRLDLIAADYGVPGLICGAERSSRGEHEAPTPITSKA
jgi:hypothetical protein